MHVPMSGSPPYPSSAGCCRGLVVGLILLISGCGGNGNSPSQTATAQQAPVAYPVPVYVQTLPPGYTQGAPQQMQAWGVPQQQLAGQQPGGQAPVQLQQQMPYQYGAVPSPAPVPAPVPMGSDNPWAMQAQQQRYANSWASSQPWAPTNQSGAAVMGRYRPLEGETQPSGVTPQVVTPYDQAYGSSKRPLPTTPGYGGYAGVYPGQYAGVVPGGYGGAYPGSWPGGYGGGYPGGYGGGYPGVWPGGYGGGFPGVWPGGYGGGFPFGGFPGVW